MVNILPTLGSILNGIQVQRAKKPKLSNRNLEDRVPHPDLALMLIENLDRNHSLVLGHYLNMQKPTENITYFEPRAYSSIKKIISQGLQTGNYLESWLRLYPNSKNAQLDFEIGRIISPRIEGPVISPEKRTNPDISGSIYFTRPK